MTFEQKIGSLFLVGVEGYQIDEETKEMLNEIQPGFVILFKRNVKTPVQIRKLIGQIQNCLNEQAIIAIDQEGGIVSRLSEGFSVSPGAMALSATGKQENAFNAGFILGEEMRELGILWDLAPVADINSRPENPGIGIRSFGDTVERVSRFSKSFYLGLRGAGVAGCAKHFPGCGDVAVDPHLGMPVLEKDLTELEKGEFVPFLELIDAGIESIMPTHLAIPKVTGEDRPISISKKALTGIIRERWGYEGIIIADDMTMGGVQNALPVHISSLKALTAGMDVIEVCHNREKQLTSYRHLLKVAHQDAEIRKRVEESSRRIAAFKKKILSGKDDSDPDFRFGGKNDRFSKMCYQSMTLYKNADDMIPITDLKKDDAIISVAPMRQTFAEDDHRGIALTKRLETMRGASRLIEYQKGLENERKFDEIQSLEGNRAIILTENAYLNRREREMIRLVHENFKKVLLIALRNPYDAGIKGVKNALLTYGYTQNQQSALIDILIGKKRLGTGNIGRKCPVEIKERI